MSPVCADYAVDSQVIVVSGGSAINPVVSGRNQGTAIEKRDEPR
jgi:hypothetical protein